MSDAAVGYAFIAVIGYVFCGVIVASCFNEDTTSFSALVAGFVLWPVVTVVALCVAVCRGAAELVRKI